MPIVLMGIRSQPPIWRRALLAGLFNEASVHLFIAWLILVGLLPISVVAGVRQGVGIL
jgi:hypothetical protein